MIAAAQTMHAWFGLHYVIAGVPMQGLFAVFRLGGFSAVLEDYEERTSSEVGPHSTAGL